MNSAATKNNKNLTKSIITLFTGTTIAQAIPIAISPVLTRIYEPEDFGLLAIFLSLTSILAVIMTARYELAIMLPKDDREAINLMGLSLVIATALSFSFLMVIIVFGKEISKLLGNEDIYFWLYFVPFSLLLTGFFQVFNYWSNRKKNYQILAVNKVVQSTSTAGANLLVGIAKNGPHGLILGHIMAQLFSTIRLSYISHKKDKINFSILSIKQMKVLAKRYDQFPKVSIWSGLLNASSVQMPVLILSAFFSSTIVGWYSLSHRVLNMPMSVLGNAVGQVFFQHSSLIHLDNPQNLKETTLKTYKALLYIGVIPMAVIFAFGDYIFAFIFGNEWIIAGQYSRALSLWLLLVFVSSPLSMLFTVMEKEGVSLLFNIGIFISRLISLLLGVVIIKDPLITILLFSGSGFVFWLWHCLYILKMVNVSYKKSLFFTLSIIFITFGGFSLLRLALFNSMW